ncbi:MAG TPA: YjbH domain-containing protein [Fontimonas sp.]
MNKTLRHAIAGALGLASAAAIAEGQPVVHGPSGYPALITTPTAAFPESGTLGLGISIAPPYNTLYLSAQPAEWLHVGARYVAITNRRYSAVNDQSFKDKSFDVAIRILSESDWRPAVALGLNDFGGTGLFSSESLVATKHYYDFGFTLGLGFGRFGTYADVRNPFAALGLREDERELLDPASEQGGIPELSEWFSGRSASIIAGVDWAPRDSRWSVQLELDGNDYGAEPSTEPLAVKSRVNVGLRYRLPGSWFASLAVIRGDTVIGQIGVAPNFGGERKPSERFEPKGSSHLLIPQYQPKGPKLDTPEGGKSWLESLQRYDIIPHAANYDAQTGTVSVWETNRVSDESVDVLRTAGRATLAHMPEQAKRLEVIEVAAGMEVLSLSADRETLDAEAREQLSAEEFRSKVEITSQASTPRLQATYPELLEYPAWTWGISPGLRLNIGGIDGFVLGDLTAKPFATLQLTRGLSVTGTLGIKVAGNLDEVVYRDSSSLPEVRSQLALYQSSGSNPYLETLEANYVFPLGKDLFGRVSAGIFESMYGGVAGEILYRPLSSRFAYGVDVNYVVQRDYDQRFEFLDYRVATGHFSVYYDTPLYGLRVKASAGRYLARDVGATLDISREFDNGLVIGAFATKTNVSSEEFGEGSFDKGIYLRIPLSELFDRAERGAAGFQYRFLTRDGGQKVNGGRPLYDIVGQYNARQGYVD